MAPNDRRRMVLERLEEDERLRGGLEDDAASALLAWAARRTGAAADDPSRSDQQVEAVAQAVRAAAYAAATSGETEPQRLVARAETELRTMTAAGDQATDPGTASKPTRPNAGGELAAQPSRSHRRRRLARYLKHRRVARR
jgi:hypothetical protein